MARQARKTDLKWTDDATSFFLFSSFLFVLTSRQFI